MPLTMPNANVLSRQLGKVGLAAKSAGPSLFSPYQSPGPTAPTSTSMFLDRNVSKPTTGSIAPIRDWSGTNYGLGKQSMSSADMFSTRQTFPGGNPFVPQQNGMNGGGSVGSFSGDKSMLNTYDSAFSSAGSQYGIDPNWLKSIAAIEGHYDNGVDKYGAVGIMGIMPGGYPGLEAMYPGWRTDPGQNIALGAAILAEKIRANGGTIEGGVQGYLGWGQDAYGTTPGAYLGVVSDYYQQLQNNGGQFNGSVEPINGMWGGNTVGNSFVQEAIKYQGVAYNWGSIPGANQDPWQTGWDCSGFTYFMNQKYGDKSLPMGSHYQYQYAQQTGKLFNDLSQLQPGDLVFIDTGWQGGAGAELNQAGHVGIYIGNGQMIHAANPSVGTIISPISGYGGIMGAMHQGASSGGGGYETSPFGGGQQSAMSAADRFMQLLAGYQGR